MLRGSGSPALLARKISLSTYYCVNPHVQEPSQMCFSHCSEGRLEVMVRRLYLVCLIVCSDHPQWDPASFRSQALHFCSNQLYLHNINRELKQQHMVLLQCTDVSWGPVCLQAWLGFCCAVYLSLGLCCTVFTHVCISYQSDLLDTVVTLMITWANTGILLLWARDIALNEG